MNSRMNRICVALNAVRIMADTLRNEEVSDPLIRAVTDELARQLHDEVLRERKVAAT